MQVKYVLYLFDRQADEVELQGQSEVGSGEKATGAGEDASPVTASTDAPPVVPDTSSIPANLRAVNFAYFLALFMRLTFHLFVIMYFSRMQKVFFKNTHA